MAADDGGFIDLGTGSTVTATGINPGGVGAYGLVVQRSGTLMGSHVTVNASGYAALVNAGGILNLTDSNLTGAQGGISLREGAAAGYSPDVNLVINGGAITATNGHAVAIIRQAGSTHTNDVTATVTLNDITINAPNGDLLNTADITGTLAITLNRVSAANAGGITVGASPGSTVNLTVNAGSGIHGDIATGNASTLTVNLNDTTQNGNITSGDNSDTALRMLNSTMLGNLTSTGAGSILLAMNQSRFTGDITQGGASLTLDLVNDSHGTGSFTHGSLRLDPTSTWNFTAPSTLDDLHNSGTITTDLNTDTGEGGKITITGSATGDGTIHINTEGNGTGDPDDILSDFITGDGTENWKKPDDPIDWGTGQVEQTEDGRWVPTETTSLTGAILNSAVVLQQALWFAQNDTLHKRLVSYNIYNFG